MVRPIVVVSLFAALGLAAAACDGAAMEPPPSGADGGAPPATPAPAGNSGKLPLTDHPYRLLHGSGAAKGTDFPTAEVVALMAGADAVCLGEKHDEPNAHAGQLLVLDLLARQATGKTLALGMEMFQVPFQQPLDDYVAGTINETVMLARTQWATRWVLDFGMYRPLLARTMEAKGSIRALNAPDELAKRIGAVGLAGLTADEKAQLPELDLTSAAHRAWFARTVQGIPAHGSVTIDNLYAAQVVRDETMADTAWRWLLAQGTTPRQLAIAAGNGHCIDLAIPMRLRRRGAKQVVTVQTVPEDQTEIATAVTDGLSDVLVVYTP